MRPIDADLMIVNGFKNKTIEVRTEDIIENHEKVVKLLFRDAIDFINKQPTIDAVRVVRCEDCKHWLGIKEESPTIAPCDAYDDDIPLTKMIMTPPHGFCFKGDKKSK